MTKSLHLKLPDNLYTEIEEAREEFGFLNAQEFLKEAARRALYEYKKQRAIARLRKGLGSVKGPIKRLSKDELDKLALNLLKDPERANRLLDKYKS